MATVEQAPAILMRRTASGLGIPALMGLLAADDPGAPEHGRVVGELAAAVAVRRGCDAATIAAARLAGLAHDIGKADLPASILAKAGPPDAAEWELIRRHPDLGADALERSGLPPAVVRAVREHHERLDGGGYPGGRRADELDPLGGIVAVCDTFAAITGDRPFRAGRPAEVALGELARDAGARYDAAAVDALRDAVSRGVALRPARRAFAGEWRRALSAAAGAAGARAVAAAAG